MVYAAKYSNFIKVLHNMQESSSDWCYSDFFSWDIELMFPTTTEAGKQAGTEGEGRAKGKHVVKNRALPSLTLRTLKPSDIAPRGSSTPFL